MKSVKVSKVKIGDQIAFEYSKYDSSEITSTTFLRFEPGQLMIVLSIKTQRVCDKIYFIFKVFSLGVIAEIIATSKETIQR